MSEVTGKRVATLAGRILSAKMRKRDVVIYLPGAKGTGKPFAVYWSDLTALAASALTQAADHGRVRPKSDNIGRNRTKSDEIGFDPRDGGKVGKQHVPRQPKNNS